MNRKGKEGEGKKKRHRDRVGMHVVRSEACACVKERHEGNVTKAEV